MELHGYIVVIMTLGVLFFASAIYAFCWSIKSGHMKDLEEASRSIFTNEEPEGVETDSFPTAVLRHSKGERL